MVYRHLMDLLDPKLVYFQFQISSMRVVGDPVMYFTTWPGRFLSMHLQGVDLNAPMPAPRPAQPKGAARGAGGRAAGGGAAASWPSGRIAWTGRRSSPLARPAG